MAGTFIQALRRWRKKKQSGSCSAFLQQLRDKGAEIGEDVWVYAPANTLIDSTAPWLLTIGDHVRIGEGVKILTHDYAWSVLKRSGPEPGAVLGAQSPVKIGSCVFIGMDAVITRGVTIGDCVIIGAGSVVTKDCPSGGVYAGNPARLVMTLEQYREKRKDLQLHEAKVLAQQYRQRFGVKPSQDIFKEYFMLFCGFEEAAAIPEFRKQMELLGNFEETKAYMIKNPPVFSGYQAFLRECFPQDGSEESGKE